MNLKTLSNSDLELQLKDLVTKERKLLHLILLHIREVDRRRLYLEKARSSLFEYLVKDMGYSSSGAQRRLEASRLLKDIPSLATKIESGSLNLSQVGLLAQAIKQNEREGLQAITVTHKEELLNKIENKNSYETQKVLSLELDLELRPVAKLIPQKDNSVHVEITLSQDQYQKLLQCKDLAAHLLLQNKKGTALPEVIETVCDQFLKLRGRSKAQSPTAKMATPRGSDASLAKPNKSLTPKIKREIFKRNTGCEYHDPLTGQKCQSHFALEVDHRIPRWAGGDHSLENLQLLCSSHNKLKYKKEAKIQFL